MAELFAGAPSTSPGDYVGSEVLAHLPTAHRRALAVLAHVGPFDADVGAAALGSEVDVADVLAGVPLVSSVGDGEWVLHELWRTLLEGVVSPDDVATARRNAAGALRRQCDRLPAAVELLIDAEAWDAVTDALVDALGVVHPPVARDVLADWLGRLSPEARAAPSGLLLAAMVGTEGDPAGARRRFEEAADGFHARGQPAGELACVVQLGHMAWWSDDAEGLATAAERAFLMESAGYEPVAPIACLARALLYDIGNDSRMMLAELDKILPGAVNDSWWGIVCWARAIALLDLGLTDEALEAADKALAHGRFLHAPLAQTTRLQALWYQGRTAEVLDALPDVVRHIERSGYRNHTALAAALAAVVYAFTDDGNGAADALAKAQAAATLVADVPLVDANLSVADAAVAAAAGDDEAARDTLAAHARRRQVGVGMAAAPQQRHLALFYVLVPETRAIWERADLGPPWALGLDLARGLVAVREGLGLPDSTPPIDRVTTVQAHLPPPWVAELGLAAIAAGRSDGWALLDGTWRTTRGPVVNLAEHGDESLRKAARDALARLPAPPSRRLALRLLGPVELLAGDRPLDAADWRRGRVRMLLAYLALNSPVSRSQAAFDLWPDLDLDGQSRNLRVTLTYLLRVLEPDRTARDASFFIRQHGNNLSLHAGEWLDVDVWTFDDHCARARDADRQGAPSRVLHHALRAVELWRDDPVELASEPWAVAPVEQRGLRFAATAVRAGELLLAQGDFDRVQELAGKALALDPWLEAGHRLVVAAHRARGDDLAARRALQRYREAVHDLGVDTSEATMMVERLLDNLP
jgi:DNA-binding SARP family transcriptional activator